MKNIQVILTKHLLLLFLDKMIAKMPTTIPCREKTNRILKLFIFATTLLTMTGGIQKCHDDKSRRFMVWEKKKKKNHASKGETAPKDVVSSQHHS